MANSALRTFSCPWNSLQEMFRQCYRRSDAAAVQLVKLKSTAA